MLTHRALAWLKAQMGAHKKKLPVEQRARALISAIDAGGVPLNPAVVNDIARELGLEVSSKAAMPDTIERIRQAVNRL